MKKYILLVLFAVLSIAHISAQRMTDPLNRGLVAVKTSSGVFVSWRVQADEYFDVAYNLYRNGTLVNSVPLSVSNYLDANGTTSSTYTVKAVINGVEQAACDAVSVWATTDGKSNPYLSIPMQDVVDRNGDIVFCCCGNHTVSSDVAQTYTLNDASVADLDGDGEVEIIIKRLNASDASTGDTYSFDNDGTKELYSTKNTRAFVIIEAYKLDGTRLWWIDCGPNMVSLGSTELNVVAYDWDQDGKAEVLMRGADNMIVHPSMGTAYTIGSSNVNTRNYIKSHTDSQYAWTRVGNEYLLYFNGATGELYNKVDFPLKRLESSEFSTTIDWENPNATAVSNYLTALNKAWGDDYGHRSNKYFFGAPFLDGRKPSIFLARGIYTRHKMIALDVNSDHSFTTKWEWSNNTSGSAWYGQGNHNFSIADVDGDGCDEIIYGSMTIDNNGKGLSTTGLGHGDAMHVGDFDPYRKGLEVFACNETNPNMNYRNATTSEIYYRSESSGDDGRAIMDNFTNDYPGSVGRSVNTTWISSVADTEVSELDKDGFINWADLNWRIYWDGDLCSEYMDSPGTAKAAVVYKQPGTATRLMQSTVASLNNDSKNNPSFAGDILGDWREELVLRNNDNTALCIYTTTYSTDYRIPSLWYDAEYRQAMVWQMCAYNQPPHLSYFLGEMEGFTQAPPTLTNTNRTELSSNDVITSSNDNAQVMVYGTGSIGIEDGASPLVLFVNVPSVVSGTGDNDNIKYSYGSCQLGATINGTDYKGDLTGSMRLVKQGDGLLKLTNRVFSYTGNTDIWAGSVFFRGTLNSPVWMNCHTTLYTAGTYNKPVTMEYGSTLNINYNKSDGTTEYSTATISSLVMKEGARVVFDIDPANEQSDVLNLTELTISSRDWEYGPEYSTPVFEIRSTSELGTGKYLIGTLSTVSGSLDDIVIEGENFASEINKSLVVENGKLYLELSDEDVSRKISGAVTTFDFENWDSEDVTLAIGSTSCGTAWEIGNKRYQTIYNCTSPSALVGEFAFQGCANTWQDKGYILRSGYGLGMVNANRSAAILDLVEGTVVNFYISDTANYPLDFTGGGKGDGTWEVVEIDGGYQVTMLTDGNLGFCMSKGGYNYPQSYITKIVITDPSILTLEPKSVDSYRTGTYDKVIVNREFKAGYSSLCVPFNTTVEEFTGGDADAFVASLDEVQVNADNSSTLVFGKGTDIEANHPYIIYMSKALSAPTMTNKPVYSESPETVMVGDWSMTGNYEIGKSMYGLYGVANNSDIRKGGSNSTINGLAAFITGPADANVRARFDNSDVTGVTDVLINTETMMTDIYSIDGLRLSSLRKGMNIVKMSDNSVRKIFVK